jgi:hypothetical protein
MDQNQRALDRFLNDLATGQASAGGRDVDPALIEVVDELRSLAHTPPPEPMRERVTSEVEIAIDRFAAEEAGLYPMNGTAASAAASPISRLSQTAVVPARSRSTEVDVFPWRLALVAAALLVLLGTGYVLFGSGLLDDDRPNTVPAAVAPTATPTPDVRSEGTVVEVTIPAAVLPAGIAGATLAHMTLLPGTTSTWTVPQNVLLNAVVGGTLVVRSASPMQVLRAPGNGDWETVPGGAEVSLGPGDLALLLTMTTADFDNPGDGPVELVQWSLATGNSATGPMPATWVLHNYDLSGGPGGVTLTGGPAVLRLERKVLAPGDTIPFAPKGVLQFVIGMPDNGAGTPVPASVAHIGGETLNFGTDPTLVYVATLTFAVPDAFPAVGTPPP